MPAPPLPGLDPQLAARLPAELGLGFGRPDLARGWWAPRPDDPPGAPDFGALAQIHANADAIDIEALAATHALLPRVARLVQERLLSAWEAAAAPGDWALLCAWTPKSERGSGLVAVIGRMAAISLFLPLVDLGGDLRRELPGQACFAGSVEAGSTLGRPHMLLLNHGFMASVLAEHPELPVALGALARASAPSMRAAPFDSLVQHAALMSHWAREMALDEAAAIEEGALAGSPPPTRKQAL